MATTLVLVAAVSVVWGGSKVDRGLAADGVVTASSTKIGFSARDAVTSGSAASPGAGWQSDKQTIGAWIEIAWPKMHTLRAVDVVRNSLDDPGITTGFLTFSDGSALQIALSKTSRITSVPFGERSVSGFRFTVSGVDPGATSAFVGEIVVRTEPADDDVLADTPDGNAAHSASVTVSANAEASDVGGLHDGSDAPGAAGAGTDWILGHPQSAWVQLTWARPREMASVQLVGAPHSPAQLARATLTFSDGSQLPVGAVLADPGLPTTVSFMPRTSTSVRLTVDDVDGGGSLALGELRVFERGATPTPSLPEPPKAPATVPSTVCGTSARERLDSVVSVACPTTGAAVTGMTAIELLVARGYDSVAATIWPADATSETPAVVRATVSPDGVARMTLDFTRVPSGPVTVEFVASGSSGTAAPVLFQVYREGSIATGDVLSSSAAKGRTLVYAEEFDRPLSISRSGQGAEFAGAKPTHDGTENFGDAPFPTDAQGFANVRVVDNSFLRIDVTPTSADGTGRISTPGHIGGLIASARPGGSGFSAQYAYFEARMLAPAMPGTWPAFWMLPSDNLIQSAPVVAEVDAVELYGHVPTGACESTHQFLDGKDSGIANCGPRFSSMRAALAWHTYGAAIAPTGITFYIDGEVVATAPQVLGGGSPMFFLANLALGGGWPVKLGPVQDRAQLYVDYIRVYV